MPFLFLGFTICCVVCSPQVGGESVGAKAKTKGASAAATVRETQKQVSLLELRESDTFRENGNEILRRDAVERISDAFHCLVNHGKSAWPVLFANLDNNTPSTPTAATRGPHTVGEKCYYILRRQITSYPRGYPYAKISADGDLDFLWDHDIQAWLEERKERTLTEIQIEALQHVIKLEREKYDADASVIEQLNERLAHLRARSDSDEPSGAPESR